MGSTLIDFAGDYGTPYSVYEAERDGEGKIKLLKTIFQPHAAQIEFFSATERHVLLHGNRGCGKSASLLWKAIQIAYPKHLAGQIRGGNWASRPYPPGSALRETWALC